MLPQPSTAPSPARSRLPRPAQRAHTARRLIVPAPPPATWRITACIRRVAIRTTLGRTWPAVADPVGRFETAPRGAQSPKLPSVDLDVGYLTCMTRCGRYLNLSSTPTHETRGTFKRTVLAFGRNHMRNGLEREVTGSRGGHGAAAFPRPVATLAAVATLATLATQHPTVTQGAR